LKKSGPAGGEEVRDVEAFLSDDGTEVALYAPDGRGHWAVASFELGRKIRSRDFDASKYERVFEPDPPPSLRKPKRRDRAARRSKRRTVQRLTVA